MTGLKLDSNWNFTGRTVLDYWVEIATVDTLHLRASRSITKKNDDATRCDQCQFLRSRATGTAPGRLPYTGSEKKSKIVPAPTGSPLNLVPVDWHNTH